MRSRLLRSVKISVAILAVIAASLTAPAQAAGLLQFFHNNGDSQQPLPVDQAYRLKVAVMGPREVEARWRIADGYYLYRDKTHFTISGDGNRILNVDMPPAETESDPNFGNVKIYRHTLIARLRLQNPIRDGQVLGVNYQGCAEAGLCYPPQHKSVALTEADSGAPLQASAAGGTGSAPSAGAGGVEGRLTHLLGGSSLAVVLAGFFVAGLLLAFTACMYPLIPILSGLIAGSRHPRTGFRAFLLSLVYVEATAVTYAAAGAVAGVSGAAVQADLQTRWVLGGFAALFVALALSMFGVFNLQLPSAWQTRLNNLAHRQRGGSVLGVAVMGALSALIVGACSGPALIAALAFISKTGDALKGGMALFALGNGMGVPLLLVGTALGRWLPRSGPWMETVKRFFGVVFLFVAYWMVERLIPPSASLAVAGVLLLGCAIFLGALDSLTGDSAAWARLRKSAGLAMLIWGALLLVGSATGGDDVWQPLKHFGFAPTAARQRVPFRSVHSVAELQAALREAKLANRPVMLDVYADWCAYCVELDRKTFSQPSVQRVLENAVTLRADITRMSPADKTLLAHLHVFLPPAVIFYNRDGVEERQLRVVGFLGPEAFASRARRALLTSAGT